MQFQNHQMQGLQNARSILFCFVESLFFTFNYHCYHDTLSVLH